MILDFFSASCFPFPFPVFILFFFKGFGLAYCSSLASHDNHFLKRSEDFSSFQITSTAWAFSEGLFTNNGSTAPPPPITPATTKVRMYKEKAILSNFPHFVIVPTSFQSHVFLPLTSFSSLLSSHSFILPQNSPEYTMRKKWELEGDGEKYKPIDIPNTPFSSASKDYHCLRRVLSFTAWNDGANINNGISFSVNDPYCTRPLNWNEKVI